MCSVAESELIQLNYFYLLKSFTLKQNELHRCRNGEDIRNIYEGESKSKGKIHLTAVIEVTVSNFTYHFST